MLTQETLTSLKGGQNVSGVVLIRDYTIKMAKNGSEYITGTFQAGVVMYFKAWGDTNAFRSFKEFDFRNVATYVSAQADDFGGAISLVIDTVTKAEGYTMDMFLPNKYNTEAYWESLKANAAALVSDKGMQVLNMVLFENQPLMTRFKIEFAAMSHHDNCKGGLLAHTYKVLLLMKFVCRQYEAATTKRGTDYTDLLYIGAILHDIGKTIEMQMGIYQPESIVNHTYLGMEIISQFKEEIIKLYGVDWYYELTSILLQHHGDFGMPCKTVSAHIVHRVDEFEASLTLLSQLVGDAGDSTSIKLDTKYLTL